MKILVPILASLCYVSAGLLGGAGNSISGGSGRRGYINGGVPVGSAVEQPTGLQPAPLPVGDPISTVPAPNSASNFESNSASDLGPEIIKVIQQIAQAPTHNVGPAPQPAVKLVRVIEEAANSPASGHRPALAPAPTPAQVKIIRVVQQAAPASHGSPSYGPVLNSVAAPASYKILKILHQAAPPPAQVHHQQQIVRFVRVQAASPPSGQQYQSSSGWA